MERFQALIALGNGNIAGRHGEAFIGVEAVIGYLVAKEIEFTAVRIIMSSRMAGISGDTIRERLRETYV